MSQVQRPVHVRPGRPPPQHQRPRRGHRHRRRGRHRRHPAKRDGRARVPPGREPEPDLLRDARARRADGAVDPDAPREQRHHQPFAASEPGHHHHARDQGPRRGGGEEDEVEVLSQVLMMGPPSWPSGKASASRAEDPGFESCLRRDFFRGRVVPVTSKLTLQWLPCQAPGVIGSALGLIGPVYCQYTVTG